MKHHIPYIRNTHLNLPRENPKTQYDIKKNVYTHCLFVSTYKRLSTYSMSHVKNVLLINTLNALFTCKYKKYRRTKIASKKL